MGISFLGKRCQKERGDGTKIVRRSSKTSSCKGTCFAQALRPSGTYELFSGNYKAKLKYKSSC